MSSTNSSEASVFSDAEPDALPHTPVQSALSAPAPPEVSRATVSPRRGPPTGHVSSLMDRPSTGNAREETPAAVPELCRRLSDRDAGFKPMPTYVSPRRPSTVQSVSPESKRERAHHLDVHDILVPSQPFSLPPQPPTTRAVVASAAADASAELDLKHPTKEPAVASPNPLRRESRCEVPNASPSNNSGSSGTATSSHTMIKESASDSRMERAPADALVDSSGSGVFSLSSIAAPRTAEEYYEQVAKIDHVRCGLGQELEGDAKEVYGPTWPFSKRMIATKVVASRPCPAPNCDHKTPVQAVTGPQIYSLLFIYGVLVIYPVFTTIAYAGKKGWGGIIPAWALSGVTIIFVTLCAFTNPGIVPRRRLQNVTDHGDVLIVRVPAPNAQAVLDKLQTLPETVPAPSARRGSASTFYTAEAIHQAVVDGDISPSVFNNKRTTVYSMERYFETDTGRIVPYNPVLSESDLAVPTLEFPILFCRTCRIARGPRTHHCKICNNCVDGMDHHCKWTNCCIGRNNYPYFFMSLVSLHVMVAYSLAYNFFQGIFFINSHKSWTLWQVLREFYGMPMVVYGSFFFLGLFFFPLLLGHIYMTMMGLTTNELLKKKWAESKYFGGVNPWSHKHWYQNVYSRLLKRWPATAEDPLRWMDSRYYYGVAVASAVEDQKVDWLIALPPEERKKVEERAVAEREAGAKARPAQEKALMDQAMRKREFRVEG